MERFDLGASVLELPVHVVKLNLGKFDYIAVRFEEAHERLEVSMRREAQVLDASSANLLDEIRQGAEALVVKVLLDVQFAHVVH